MSAALKNYLLSRCKVSQESGCWIWDGPASRTGHGHYTKDKKSLMAHYGAWVAWNGDIPDKMRVKHNCSNRLCINPRHLRLEYVKCYKTHDVEYILANSKPNELTGCRNWQGRLNAKGYGIISVGKASVMMHRAAWECQNGPVPDEMMVCHRCDNPRCVNHEHLFIGTIADNHADMVSKGRQQKGSGHYRAKLTEADIVAIRNSAEQKPALAKKYGVSYATIKSIVNRQNWKHVS